MVGQICKSGLKAQAQSLGEGKTLEQSERNIDRPGSVHDSHTRVSEPACPLRGGGEGRNIKPLIRRWVRQVAITDAIRSGLLDTTYPLCLAIRLMGNNQIILSSGTLMPGFATKIG